MVGLVPYKTYAKSQRTRSERMCVNAKQVLLSLTLERIDIEALVFPWYASFFERPLDSAALGIIRCDDTVRFACCGILACDVNHGLHFFGVLDLNMRQRRTASKRNLPPSCSLICVLVHDGYLQSGKTSELVSRVQKGAGHRRHVVIGSRPRELAFGLFSTYQ